MTKAYSYTESHKYEGKGGEYEECYRTQPWQKFLWMREQGIILRILEKYFQGRDIDLLDFACGTGRITSFLEQRVKTSTAIDVSETMLAIAREKLRRTELIEADITKANILKGRKFNLITAFRFFLNAERELRSAVMNALGELLADDGYFVFNNHHNLGSPWIRFGHWLYRRRKQRSIYNVMSVGEIRELVGTAGLRIAEIYPAGFFHPPKVPFSQRLNLVIDGAACRLRCLSRFAEDIVVVCTWEGKGGARTLVPRGTVGGVCW